MRILVVMVTYNGARWLETSLRALRDCGMPVDLYVYDNASADGSADAVAALWPEAVIVRGTENIGFAAANNAGFRYALGHGYDAVYLLNQDAWPLPGAMAILAGALERHPDYALLSPMQLQRTDSSTSLGMTESLDPQFEKNVWRKAGEERDGIREVPRVMAAHWMVRCEALRKVGLFSEMLPIYGQDDNWCDRAQYHGLRIGIVPEAKAIHDRAQRKEPKERIIYRNYYMGSLVRLLDIRRPGWERRLFVLLFTLVKTVKYFSLKPLRYYFKYILPARKDILSARAQTRQTC